MIRILEHHLRDDSERARYDLSLFAHIESMKVVEDVQGSSINAYRVVKYIPISIDLLLSHIEKAFENYEEELKSKECLEEGTYIIK